MAYGILFGGILATPFFGIQVFETQKHPPKTSHFEKKAVTLVPEIAT